MMRFLLNTLTHFVLAAIGLLVCFWIFPDFHLQLGGFLVAVLVFGLAQGILAPFIFNLARQYASAVLGGIGLVTTFVSLLIASLFPGGITISSIGTWVLATLVMWIITALGTWILGGWILRRFLPEERGRKKA